MYITIPKTRSVLLLFHHSFKKNGNPPKQNGNSLNISNVTALQLCL